MNESITNETTIETNNESLTEQINTTVDEVSNEEVITHGSNVNQNNTTSTGVALTTFDNPYDPFDQFTSWFLFDVERGYNTCSYLARIVKLTDDMSEEEVDVETERAIDEIIEYDFMNIYKKIRKNELGTN